MEKTMAVAEFESKSDLEPQHVKAQHLESLGDEEHKLTFVALCRQYPKIVWWSFFWCMTAVSCRTEHSCEVILVLTRYRGFRDDRQ